MYIYTVIFMIFMSNIEHLGITAIPLVVLEVPLLTSGLWINIAQGAHVE